MEAEAPQPVGPLAGDDFELVDAPPAAGDDEGVDFLGEQVAVHPPFVMPDNVRILRRLVPGEGMCARARMCVRVPAALLMGLRGWYAWRSRRRRTARNTDLCDWHGSHLRQELRRREKGSFRLGSVCVPVANQD